MTNENTISGMKKFINAIEMREKLLDKLAQKVTDDADIHDLMEFFYNKQYEYFDDFTDDELLEEAENLDVDIDE